MAKKQEGASLRPSDHSEATGLWQGRGKVAGAAFVMFDYGGKSDPKPTAQLNIQPEEGGDVVEQHWSVGKDTDWMPSEDGSRLVAIGRATQINTSSNLSILITSMVNAGFPEDKLTDNIGDLVGLDADFVRVAAPKRPGLPVREGQQESQILIVNEIFQLPWEKKAGKPAAAKAAKPTGKAATAEEAGEEESAEDLATALVVSILAEKGSIKKQQLSTHLFKELKGNPRMKEIMQVAYSDDFLSEGPWTFEGGELSMG
jgi:hypothetical protein